MTKGNGKKLIICKDWKISLERIRRIQELTKLITDRLGLYDINHAK